MGKFGKKEELIIRKIVDATKFTETFLATLIDGNSDAIALEWDIEFLKFKFIYRSVIFESDNYDFIIFDKIKEVIFLLKYLEDEKFIYVLENKGMTKDNCLYNRTKYVRKDDGEYYTKKGNIEINGQPYRAEGLSYSNLIEIPCDFGKLVQHFGNGIFHVATSLRELVEHDFKTSEQIRHEEAMSKAQKQVKLSQLAFIVSLITLLFSLGFDIWEKNSETTINQSQLNQIKHTIEQKTLPDVFITKILNDTLTTRIVDMPKTQKAKPKQN